MSLKKLGLAFSLWSHSGIAQALETTAAADYVQTFEKGDPFIVGSLSLNQELTRHFSLFLSQGFQKNIYIDSETPEPDLSDTALGLTLKPTSMVPRLTYAITFSATLPVSLKSREDDAISRLDFRPGVGFAFHKYLQLNSGAGI